MQGFTIDLQQKDLDLIPDFAGDLGVPLIATGMIRQLYVPAEGSQRPPR